MNNDSTKPSKLRIDKLALSNFRCFPELEVDLDSKLTVIVANNGQGKTAVLDAIAIALGPFVGAFDDGKDRPFHRDDIRLIATGDGNRMESAAGGVRLEAWGMVDFESAAWSRELAGPKSRTTWKHAKALTEYGKRLQNGVRNEADGKTTGICLPLVACYPTDRLWNLRRLPYKKLPRTSRMTGYTHALESGSDFHLMADWFQYWSFNSANRRAVAFMKGEDIIPGPFDDALEVIRDAINTCLKPSGWGDMDFNVESHEIVARHPVYGELPIAMLSDGIRGVLTLVADIAFRMVKLNPNLGPFATRETGGIVLIDEVDMHLHPSWQQTILQSLCEAFPKVQFIVTTHSPQVLTSVDASSIRMLRQVASSAEKNPAITIEKVEFQTKGVASSDLLARIMGTDPIPDVPEAGWVSDYQALIEQNLHRQPQGLALRQTIEDHFGPQHPVIRELDRLIRLQDFKQRLPQNLSGADH